MDSEGVPRALSCEYSRSERASPSEMGWSCVVLWLIVDRV